MPDGDSGALTMRYEATVRNLTFGQAQALYRMLVDLGDDEVMHGVEGMSWSGVIPSNSSRAGRGREDRTVTINPMPGEDC